MRIVFCVYDFTQNNLSLQPWLTFCKVGQELAKLKHEVHVVTDAPDFAEPPGLYVHYVGSLRGLGNSQLARTVKSISPDSLVFMPTPLNLPALSWLNGMNGCRKIAFASYPFYVFSELLQAGKMLGFAESLSYTRHLCMPSFFWRRFLHYRFDAVISQSQSTRDRLASISACSISTYAIMPGIDLDKWPLRPEPRVHRPVVLLYMGSAKKIRGFEILLDALAMIEKKSVLLRILARGADEKKMLEIQSAIEKKGLKDRVELKGGWMDQSLLVQEMHACTAVVLPFLLVPSELPVSVMEAIACGVPVIGSRIDGLPSAIGSAGIVAEHADTVSLAGIIKSLHDNPEMFSQWYDNCRIQRSRMRSWEEVSRKWEKVLIYAG